MMNPLLSIIIRTKNEERWISQCLGAVFSQDYKNFEVILVDNESTDRTVEKAKQFPIQKIVTCKEYRPGKALNLGILEAKGEYIVCLSGHCIPVNNQWLDKLLQNFSDPKVAGVYGRQEPMSFTSPVDKRDLAIVFGLDRKVQIKDSFFHNANSMIRANLWREIPFDDQVTNIEDRIWARALLQKGSKIVYEPEASVYHHHGIHQNLNLERCASVVQVLESIDQDYRYKAVDIEALNVVALIPLRGPLQYLNGKPLLAYTMERARESKGIKKIIVATDDPKTAEVAKELGAEVPFLRDPALSKDFVDLLQVFQYSLEQLEARKIFPDLLVTLEVTFPFRPRGLLDGMLSKFSKGGFDSLVAVRRENRGIWKKQNGGFVQVEEGITPRAFKQPTYVELRGVALMTHPEFLREGDFYGNNVGIYEIDNPTSSIEVRHPADFEIASLLMKGGL